MFPFCVDEHIISGWGGKRAFGDHPSLSSPFASCMASCKPNQLEWGITQNEGTLHQGLHNECGRPLTGEVRGPS